jgi:serine/threonine protein kinase/DNA-binding beta-propeller fold protein YncE
MKLNPGTRLGPYEVVAAIGAGAMGEVYRAKDARLGREVAIKVLPASHSNDPDRLHRFEQEARAAGTLNHPNILAIYDIGAQDSSPYVVSELLEGETLRDGLGSGAFSPRKATEYAIQLAHGLAAAHQKGIVHRDLKPENLFITTDGRLKILDFGLAKLIQPDPTSESQTNLPTAAGGTQPGVLLGTMGYMSPEQVRGKPADARSDIFAFGAILYEMLSGARAFHGDSAVETMNAILKEDPPELSSTNRTISPGHERIVQRCLEKNPDERFQSARDLAFGLEALSGHSGISVAGPAPAARLPRRWLLPAALVLAGAALLAIGFFAGKQTGSAGAKPSFPSFHRLTFRNGYIDSSRFAPDGQTILYSASWDGKPQEIFSTRTDSPEFRSLGLPTSRLFSVASSGEVALGLHRTAKDPTLARVSLGGGAPRELLDEVNFADWSPNGSDLAVVRRVGRQNRLEFPIGKVIYETFNYIGTPRVSSKGDLIAFSESNAGRGSVTIIDLAGKRTTLSSGWKGVDDLAWSPSGDEVWFSATETGFGYAVYAVNVSGSPSVRLLLRIAGPAILRDVARDGRVLLMHSNVRTAMMCLPPGETKERDLAWLDADVPVALSDDGKTLLFNEYGEASGTKYPIYIRKTDGSEAVLLGEGSARALSPDGKWVAIIPLPGVSEITLLPTGAGQSKSLKNDVIQFYGGAAWFPDGKRIVTVAAENKDRTMKSWVIDLAGGNPRPITPEGVTGLLVSPDGKFLLAVSAEQKRALYPVEGGEPRPVSGFEERDRAIRWSADGRSVFVHQTGEHNTRIFLIDIATGRRTLWKELAISEPAGSAGIREVFLTPDGKSYVYWYVRELSDLYLVEGLK